LFGFDPVELQNARNASVGRRLVVPTVYTTSTSSRDEPVTQDEPASIFVPTLRRREREATPEQVERKETRGRKKKNPGDPKSYYKPRSKKGDPRGKRPARESSPEPERPQSPESPVRPPSPPPDVENDYKNMFDFDPDDFPEVDF
jgi:hypothetical protein